MTTPPVTPRRILVYGVTGSGKSTAAARIATAFEVPLILADEVAWQPGWKMLGLEQQRKTFADLAGGDCWVFDTAYGTWLDLVLPRVELVVALDYPRWVSLQRLLRRTAARIVTRAPVCNGNTESVRMALSRDSILLWHFRSFARKRRRIIAWSSDLTGPTVHRFRKPADLERWIRSQPASR